MSEFLENADYEVKQWEFGKFAELIKWNTAIGKLLRSARYRYEMKPRADNPQLTHVEEWLEIKTGGYLYKISANRNSQLENETALMDVLLHKAYIGGFISKEEI